MEIKTDLRVTKTIRLVFDTMFTFMSRRSFEQITVYELCNAAQISRATFYVHFEDKYDLLKLWLTSLIAELNDKIKSASDEKKKEHFGEFINKNKKIMENLLMGTDDKIFDILFGVICSFSTISSKDSDPMNPEYVVLSNIYIGGILSYLRWQVKNKFPREVEVLNEYIIDIVKKIL